MSEDFHTAVSHFQTKPSCILFSEAVSEEYLTAVTFLQTKLGGRCLYNRGTVIA
jgi:hypothetical protein